MSASFPASRPAARGSRPTAVVGLLSGGAVALLGLVLCAAVGLVGWYLSDAGSHGVPRDGIMAGARGWLVALGSGLSVDGVPLTLRPLGVTVLLAWLVWQAGLRLGEMVWNHGPDEARRSDGERDLTLAQATGGFVVGHLAVTWVTLVATGDNWGASGGSALRWSLAMTLLLGLPAIALGSGRAARWIEATPEVLRDAVAGAGRLLLLWLGVSALFFLLALILGLGEARDVLQQLGTSPAESLLVVLGCLVLVPNAVLWSGAFLMGPGFSVGAGTVVAPSGVLLGELPLLPILAALPDQGDLPGIWAAYVVVPVLVAAVAVGRRHVRLGHVDWVPSLLAGGGAGVIGAAAIGLLSAVAGGAAGPGRLAAVGPVAGEVFLAALLPFVAGGLLGAAVGTFWVRRSGVPVPVADEVLDEEQHEDTVGVPDVPVGADSFEDTVTHTPLQQDEAQSEVAAGTDPVPAPEQTVEIARTKSADAADTAEAELPEATVEVVLPDADADADGNAETDATATAGTSAEERDDETDLERS